MALSRQSITAETNAIGDCPLTHRFVLGIHATDDCAAAPVKLFLEPCGVYTAVIVQDVGIRSSIP